MIKEQAIKVKNIMPAAQDINCFTNFPHFTDFARNPPITRRHAINENLVSNYVKRIHKIMNLFHVVSEYLNLCHFAYYVERFFYCQRLDKAIGTGLPTSSTATIAPILYKKDDINEYLKGLTIKLPKLYALRYINCSHLMYNQCV